MMKKKGDLFKLILACVFVGAHFCVIASGAQSALHRAKVLVANGQYKDAVVLLKQYEPQDSEDELNISLLTGKIYLAIDRPAKALEFFEDAQSQDLENFDALIGAAHANLKLGKFKESERYAQAAKRLDPQSAEPDFISAVIGLRKGYPIQANDFLLRLTQKSPDSESALIAYAKFLSLTGENQSAKKYAINFLTRKPHSPEVQDYLADLEHQTGSKAEAIRFKKNAAQLYEQQGKLLERDIIFSWIEKNGSLPSPETPLKPQAQALVPGPQGKADSPPAVAAPFLVPELPGLKVERQPLAPKPGVEPIANPEAFKAAIPARKEARTKPTYAPENELVPPVQRFPFPPNVMITGGSGFIVDGGKKVVTNRHVIEDGKEFAIRTGLGEVIRVRVVFISQTDDIAVLELEKPLPADRAIPASAYSKPRVGRSVVVMGYPLWYMLGEGSPSLTNGMVSKRTGLRDDLGTFQLTAKVNKGNSGGPVFDLFGNVVGITVGKLDLKKIQTDEGFVPEDVNFAIHVDRMPAIANVKLGAPQSDGTELSTEELYQAMLGKVVMVATYK